MIKSLKAFHSLDSRTEPCETPLVTLIVPPLSVIIWLPTIFCKPAVLKAFFMSNVIRMQYFLWEKETDFFFTFSSCYYCRLCYVRCFRYDIYNFSVQIPCAGFLVFFALSCNVEENFPIDVLQYN